jgi:putative transposase
MAREKRFFPPETAMHIICRGNNKLPILANSPDKKQYYFILFKFKLINKIDILHYCIMDNHIHLIIWLNNNSRLSRFIKQISLAYYYYYKREYDYCGHLWQGRYRSIIIKSDTQALQCGKYIELNPVRAKIVAKPEQYQFSSYGYYAMGKQDPLVTPSQTYTGLHLNPLIKKQIYSDFVVGKEALPFIDLKRELTPFS